MKALYLASVCDKKMFQNDILIEKGVGFQAQKFNWIVVNGLLNNSVEVDVISSRPINQYDYEIKYYKKETAVENGANYNYVGFYNYKIIRQISLAVNASIMARQLAKNVDIVICDVLNLTLGLSVCKSTKKMNKKTIGIVTDLPEFISKNETYISNVNKLMDMCDGYVFLAEAMNLVVNKKDKPYIVIEGFADIHMGKLNNLLEQKYDKRVVLYSGGLFEKYGLDILVKGFIDAKIENTELHLYGSGSYEKEIKEFAKKFNNVKFFGSVANEVVVEAQRKSTLLVNPRPTTDEFVKYSFPSKNIEYMASGTPVLTTNLPSMPKEYRDYCFIVEDESVAGMSKKLKDLLEMNKLELNLKGIDAKNWVLENKNNTLQTKKILKLIERLS